MARRCKCHHCKEWIEKDEERVEHNITEKQKKYFHTYCLPKFIKEKEIKDIEVKKWNNLYEYIKVEIMGYTKEKQKVLFLIRRKKAPCGGNQVR